MATVAVILAGGVGSRFGYSIPKQMVKVAGKTILEHTLDVFQASEDIDEIVLMVTPGWVPRLEAMLNSSYSKLTDVLEGGNSRNDTTWRFIESRRGQEHKVILHDAVRPLVDHRIIADCVAALDDFDAVDVVIPSADTIVEVDSRDVITAIPNRSQLRRGQTPQAFTLSVLRDAYERALEDPYFSATDDCGVVLQYLPQAPIKTVLGSEHNLKITHPVDLFIADRLFQLATHAAPVHGSNAYEGLHGRTIVVFGGSSGIGASIAELAAAHGARVIAHSRSTTGIDVRRREDVEHALNQAAADYGRIDAVILTAGVLHTGTLVDLEREHVDETLEANLLAPVHVARAAHPYLRKSRGHLQFFTSSSYTRGRENYALYSATKAGVVNLTQALAEEWAGDGVRVNVINPERTATPMRTAAFGHEDAQTLLSATSVAEAALDILCSGATGLVVDVRKGERGARSAAESIDQVLRAEEARLSRTPDEDEGP